MILTSYADNFEDALLWRALGHIANGFYIDAGAGDPERGSLTCALYGQGWRGINVEPAQGQLRRLRMARPADTSLGLALVAAEQGAASATFHEVPGSGLSTLDPQRAAALRAAGQSVLLREVELGTLDAVCAAHAPEAIHLLSLNTGGGEAELLAGMDLQRWRPWVIVLPHAGGEPLPALLAARYRLAQATGARHFYVAEEQADAQGVAARLALPLQAAQDFVLCEDHPRAWPLDELRARVAAAQAATAAVEAERLHQAALAANARADLADARLLTAEARTDTANAIADARHTIDDLLVRLRDADTRAEQTAQWAKGHVQEWERKAEHAAYLLRDMEARAGHQAQTLDAVYASLSWRITAPLRWTKFQLGRCLRYARRQPGRARAFAVRTFKGTLRGAMQFVIARPKLSFTLRRSASLLPFVVPLLRSMKIRLEATQRAEAAEAAAPSGPQPTVPSQIPDAARQVLVDLRRRASHS